MRLNTVGSALYGVGVGTIYVDGVAIPSLSGSTANTWSWLTDAIAAGQANFGGGYHLYQVIVATDAISQIAATGYNLFAAGGGNYGKFLVGTGVETNVGGLGPFPLAAMGDVSPDGFYAIIANYQAGSGINTFSASGTSLYKLTTTLAGGSEIRCKSGIFAYRESAGTHLRSLSTGILQAYAPRTGDITFQCVPFILGGVTWVVEAVGAGVSTLSLRQATSSMGFLIETGDTFNIDVCSPSAGVIRVGWCTGAGEAQTQLRMADVTLATGGVTTWSTSTGTLVSTVQTPLVSMPFTVGPVESGDFFASIDLPQHQQVLTQNGLIDPIWLAALQDGANAGVGMIDVNRLQGVVPPELGGTGVTTGLTVLDGGNILPGTIPCSAIQGDCLSALSGSWIPLVTGAEPPVFVTDGSGVLILVAGPS